MDKQAIREWAADEAEIQKLVETMPRHEDWCDSLKTGYEVDWSVTGEGMMLSALTDYPVKNNYSPLFIFL